MAAAMCRSSNGFRALARIRASNTFTTCRHFRATSSAIASKGGASETPFFPDEPAGPQLKTSIPGPKSQKAIDKLNRVFDTRSLNMLVNYDASIGN